MALPDILLLARWAVDADKSCMIEGSGQCEIGAKVIEREKEREEEGREGWREKERPSEGAIEHLSG